jgi:hypothetical protein
MIGEAILPFLRRTPKLFPAPAISEPVLPWNSAAAALHKDACCPANQLRDTLITETERTGLLDFKK